MSNRRRILLVVLGVQILVLAVWSFVKILGDGATATWTELHGSAPSPAEFEPYSTVVLPLLLMMGVIAAVGLVVYFLFWSPRGIGEKRKRQLEMKEKSIEEDEKPRRVVELTVDGEMVLENDSKLAVKGRPLD